MSKLEEIFAISEDQERLTQLVAYGRKLRVDVTKAKRGDGSYDENKLAVLIFQKEVRKKTNRFQNVIFLMVGIVFALVMLGAIYLLVVLLG